MLYCPGQILASGNPGFHDNRLLLVVNEKPGFVLVRWLHCPEYQWIEPAALRAVGWHPASQQQIDEERARVERDRREAVGCM